MANEYLNNKTFESIILAFQSCKRLKARSEQAIADLEETRLRRQKADTTIPILEERQKELAAACATYKSCQSQLAAAFYLLSENIANYAKFSGIDTDDAIQEGVVICFEKVDRFNPNYRGKSGQKAKAFNYMTTCILNHFRQLYRSARNYGELKRRYYGHLQDTCDRVYLRNGRERSAAGGQE